MTDTAIPAPAGDELGEDISLLSWLQTVADQNVPPAYGPAKVPVAWLGRTSTEDIQDPTLSLPRQLDNSRRALPDEFVIVAHFYDVESGRTLDELRGQAHTHEQFDIPIPRDGSVADLLTESTRPDRRFVAVICESIERVARTMYGGTKIEHELEQAGVALLAADEGIDRNTIPALAGGSGPVKRATPTLTRRVKQAIAEFYVLQMLELSWGGFKIHTDQGYNIGKPPYGYQAKPLRHPVEAKALQGRHKHKLVIDPIRGPVVTQVFRWRALERLSYQAIADRHNLDAERYPPPDPIPGRGRRRIGAWTYGSVREVLDNPKHTGYMVWNRRKNPRTARGVKGRVNPPHLWVWSRQPTHEPLITRSLFEAASTVGRFRQGSRPAPAPTPTRRPPAPTCCAPTCTATCASGGCGAAPNAAAPTAPSLTTTARRTRRTTATCPGTTSTRHTSPCARTCYSHRSPSSSSSASSAPPARSSSKTLCPTGSPTRTLKPAATPCRPSLPTSNAGRTT
jgi:DNA invertase Pin-like site-specific DNA recombinase